MIKDETAIETRMRQAVGDAAALLDEHAIGWRERIDVDRLDIEDPCDCILGQLYGWFEGKRVLYGSETSSRVSPAFYTNDALPYWLEELSA